MALDYSSGHRNFDVDMRVDGDLRDGLDHLGRALYVEHALVNTHLIGNLENILPIYLIAVPGLRTFAARRLTGRNAQRLRRQTCRAFHIDLVVDSLLDEFLAN